MAIRLILVVAGCALGLWARSVAVTSGGVSFATRDHWGSFYLLGVGWLAMIVAVVVLPERPRPALLLYGLGAWWFVAELASPSVGSAGVFTAALVLAPAGPALIAQFALSYPTGQVRGWPSTSVVVAGYVLMIGLMGIVCTTVFDPSMSGCFDCPANPILIHAEAAATDQLNLAGLRLGAAWLVLALAAVSLRGVIAAGRGWATTLVSLIIACGFLGASASHYLTSVPVGTLTRGGLAPTVWIVHGAAIVALATLLVADLVRARRSRRELTRLVVELRDSDHGGLRLALARRLQDPRLTIGYPIEGGRRHVGADARSIDLTPTAAQVVTPLTYAGTELATMIHRRDVLRQPHQVDELVSSVHLALESERLAAEDLVQFAEIQSSGARIIAAGDAERRRIERDLHDGAQQRLVALLLTVRLASEEGESPDLHQVEAELRRAISELRQLAHGIYPVLLKDAWPKAALDALAETHQLTVTMPDERYPDIVESTIYQLVSRLATAESTTVAIRRVDDKVLLDGTATHWQQPDMQDLHDRVQTLGGTLQLSSGTTSTSAHMTLPLMSERPTSGQ